MHVDKTSLCEHINDALYMCAHGRNGIHEDGKQLLNLLSISWFVCDS